VFQTVMSSRAFVAIRDAEEQTAAARIIGAFIRKDVAPAIERRNEVLLSGAVTQDDTSGVDEQH